MPSSTIWRSPAGRSKAAARMVVSEMESLVRNSSRAARFTAMKPRTPSRSTNGVGARSSKASRRWRSTRGGMPVSFAATVRAWRRLSTRLADSSEDSRQSRVVAGSPLPSAAKAATARIRAAACSAADLASKTMLFHAPVQRGAGQAQILGRQRDVVGVAVERLADQRLLRAFQIEVDRFGRRQSGAGRGDGGADGRDQPLIVPGLHDEIGGAHAHRLDRDGQAAMAGDHHYDGARVALQMGFEEG